MRIQILFFVLLFSTLAAKCQRTSAGVTIPPQQTFLLGEYEDDGYTAKLVNKGAQNITIELKRKADDALISSVQLSPKQAKSFEVESGQVVAMVNSTDTEAQVSAKMSTKVVGMRYVEAKKSKASMQEEPQTSTKASPKSYSTVSNASSATSEVKETVSKGQTLILGEGTSDSYSFSVRKIGGSIKVSIRNRETNEQTQGFGLGNVGVEEVNIRPYEVVYLINTGSVPAMVSVGFSKPVNGLRKVEL